MRKSPSDKNFQASTQRGRTTPRTLQIDASLEKLVHRATSPDRQSFVWAPRSRRSANQAIDSLCTIWGQLPRSLRREILAQSEMRVLTRLRLCAISQDAALRRAAAAFPRFTPIPASIDLLSVLLRDDEPGVIDQTQRTLHALADHLGTLHSHQRDALEHTAIEIVQTYPEHHSNEAITAIERLGPWLGPAWRAWLLDADDADLMLLRAALRRADDEHAPTRAVGWLAVPNLAGVALEQLKTRTRDSDVLTATRAAHLLRAPSRRHALRFRAGDIVASTLDAVSRFPKPETLARIAWTRALHRGDFPLSSQAAREALVHTSRDIRWPIARRCAQAAPSSSESLSLLRDFTFDADPSVARSSTIALLTEHPDVTAGHVEVLQRSPHASVRQTARLAALPARQWETRAALRCRLHESPDLVLARLRGELASSTPALILDALGTITRLLLVPQLERDILGLLQHEEPRVCAGAVTLAGSIQTAASRAAVAAIFTHDDPRVRANTIEAVSRHDPQASIVVRAAFDDIPRLRANSIRARFGTQRDEAWALLDAMLCDDRPGHRLSALWVAQRVGQTSLATRIASFATTEPDIRVRKRAEWCARSLLARVRTSQLPSPARVETSDTHAALA